MQTSCTMVSLGSYPTEHSWFLTVIREYLCFVVHHIRYNRSRCRAMWEQSGWRSGFYKRTIAIFLAFRTYRNLLFIKNTFYLCRCYTQFFAIYRYSQWLSFLHCSTGSDVLPPLMESRFREPEGFRCIKFFTRSLGFSLSRMAFYFYRFCWFCSCILLFLFFIWSFCFFTSNAKELSLKFL